MDQRDDAPGRTLDTLYAYGVSELYEKIAKEALKRLSPTPAIVHLDSTSFHVDGAYSPLDDADTPRTVRLVKGYSRDHYPQLNQTVLNLIVEHEAGIPLWDESGRRQSGRYADLHQRRERACHLFSEDRAESNQSDCRCRLVHGEQDGTYLAKRHAFRLPYTGQTQRGKGLFERTRNRQLH
ncbi:hypothetical protein [Hydrogenimonas sp.]